MLGKLLFVCILAAAAYWYWSGPYRDRVDPDYETQLRQNDEAMRTCIRARNYRLGATGEGDGDAEATCAREHNLYLHEDGRWHSYGAVRQ